MTTDEKRRGTAYHEAGHAVIARRLGYTVHSVTIKPGDDYQGLAVSDSPLFGRDPAIDNLESGTNERVEHRIISAFAGPVAEHRFNPEEFNPEGSRDDYDKIGDLVFYLVGHPDQATAKCDELEERTRFLVSEHWPYIGRMARALLDRTELTGDDLEALIGLRSSLYPLSRN